MMRRYFIPLVVVVCVIIGTFLFTKSQLDKQYEVYRMDNANIVGDRRYLELLVESMINGMNQSVSSSALLTRGEDSLALPKVVSFPCLLIYIPETDNICMGCVDYAIEAVKKVFVDFEHRTDIGIISQTYNPDLKERIINKKVYFLQEDSMLITVHNEFDSPLYLVLNNECRVVSSFVPNANFENLVFDYLSKVKTGLLRDISF